MININITFSIFFLALILQCYVAAWGGDELEVFDVVEEVNQNFYTLLDVPQDADQSALKKAFRRLSLVLHPDKNDAPDADVKFRQLVAVYDILKNPSKRKCYNDVLQNGLPDWKHAMYYYRRMRKMGLAEMVVIMFIIITIGQVLIGWASYLEKKYNLDEFISSKAKNLKRKQKKGKIDGTFPAELGIEIEKPSVKDTLPCQIPRLIWFLLVSAPPLTYQWIKDYLEERELRKQQEAEEQEESEEEPEVPRGPRRRKPGFTLPELKDEPQSNDTERIKTKKPPKPTSPPVISGGLWTDDDLIDLAKLVKKYPVGTMERWEKIGDAMNRPPNEVAHMAHKLKDNVIRNLGQKENEDTSEEEAAEEPKKVKTRGGKLGEVNESNVANWTQVQQKALEAALSKIPKGATTDRWEKIAKCVPGKTKEDCMLRYKYLVELVKKKKEKEESETNCDPQTDISKED